jgi:hypothetical protein
MGNTTDGFNKKRDHNQYGEVEKDKNEKDKGKELPKSPNKGTEKKKE